MASLMAKDISFKNDIRPILSDKCFQCHGPDAGSRKADLRFDLRESAITDLGGYAAIVPGSPDKSALMHRIESKDADEVMPPTEIHKPVKPRELTLLRQWINEGAEYEEHWAYTPIQRPVVPPETFGWAQNAIDAFIARKLRMEGLEPSPLASPEAILRRLSLDLTGLPPTPDFVGRHAGNIDQGLGVETAIRQLLASPKYGEHMAWAWLDAARYADSDGYESDPLRSMWPWRDWVVEAFNRNLPFDQFITEQLAGDLLPNPTLRQKLATGFNRNHRLNNEGGILPEEWIVEYVCDRAETAATVFMGLTWSCARCHDHKFDPITQRDYFQLFSFFNNLDEKGSVRGNNAPPAMDVPALEHFEEYSQLTEKITPLRTRLDALAKSPDFKAAHAAWLKEVATSPEVRKKIPGAAGTTDYKKWSATHKSAAREHYLVSIHAPAELRSAYLPLDRRISALRRSGSRVMVMEETAEPKQAFILARGAYDQPTDPVEAETPSFLPPMDPSLPRNRLGLAAWLTSPEHPLTSRVIVNREWERFFGMGLVKTQEDFGSQGEPPSHPELLDYLAAWFIDSGWDLKALHHLMVSSATYQQSAATSESLLAVDPENRLLARGPRYRLPAAVLRDQALAASGLLVDEPGGPPVKPYQPDGLWQEIIKGRVKYEPDSGKKLYRRSLYTLWRRAVKPPLMELLDSNLRDTCAVSTKRTNTPLQALLLLNDTTFVEAARELAVRMIRSTGRDREGKATERLAHGMHFVLGRDPTNEELTLLQEELNLQRSHFASHPEDARALVAVGEHAPPDDLAHIELAAYTAVARILLNLDESLSKG